ncbi:MAG: glycosyltransferase 87 family protein, partial [Dehalococcoidia bacterium]|nr:glycosyltransferase 87 family protein [Dehalococcoidia bacterium]
MGRRFPLSLDALLVTALALTRARVDTFANAVVPRPLELTRQTPIVGQLIPADAFALLDDFLADPISQLILATTMGLVCAYLVVDLAQGWRRAPSARLQRVTFALKWTILVALATVSVGGNTVAMMSLRANSTPSQYAHDGGVLEADLALAWLFEGKNVYQQSWRGTWVEMAYPNGPGLSSYPYLPFAFLSGAPFYLATQHLWGWYDHRLVYLAAYAVILALGAFVARGYSERLSLLALLALNPILANDMIYGFNDMLVVALLVAAFWAYQRGRWLLGGVMIGLAVATKGTVWPILPFIALWLWRGRT